MAHTIQRLTMYALISALERDLRDFLISYVAPLLPPGHLLPEAMRKRALDRLLKENQEREQNDPDLVEYLDFGEELQAVRVHDGKLDNSTRSYIKKYYIALEGVIPIRNRVMHFRPLEFDDLARLSDLASDLVKSNGALWANLRTTRRDLEKNPDYVSTLTIPETIDNSTKLLHNLPPVEFEDTGFVGRDNELNELKRALLGSYPVVTIIGEGGLGKTALALKACYDLLDDADAHLDAIVWTTAKANKLTLNEIQHIEGAISSSLGIIDYAASLLGRQDASSALDDLIMHLENNRILLVIDNLETVIDQNIRELVRRVPSGSRILFTTRIGLGAFDFPISLNPLNSKEANFYFRRTARVWSVNDFASATTSVVDGYCEKLQYNPLFIKWFVQSVRAGKRPTSLTSDPKLLLTFCLQNVFNALSVEAKAVASTLACINGPQSVASLAFFTDYDSITIQSALSFLLTSNLVSAERGRNAEDEDMYFLSPLARVYIQKIIRPGVEEQKRLLTKQNILRSAQEEFTAKAGTDIFNMNHVFVRDKHDYIVAKILSKAIEHIFRSEFTDAEDEIRRALDLSPNYFEVRRVEAQLKVAEEDFLGAEVAYEAAISLAPERAPLRLWFGGFLSRNLSDQDRALEQLLEAERLAPTSAIVKLECARVLQYLRQFGEAEMRLHQIPDIEKLSAKTRRVHLDLSVQNELRKAEYFASKEQFPDALECLERARAALDRAPRTLIDQRTLKNVAHASRQLPALMRAFRGLSEEARVASISQWLNDPAAWLNRSNGNGIGLIHSPVHAIPDRTGNDVEHLPKRGRVINLHPTYGFIDSGGIRLFFHRGSCVANSDFRLEEGTEVEFAIGDNGKGPCAVNVKIVEPTQSQPTLDAHLFGHVKSKRETFGFIEYSQGRSIFFHTSMCSEGTKFRTLQVGEKVRFKVGTGRDGNPCAIQVERHSGL